MKTALYRHFDATGRLLYIGITNHSLRRLSQHAERAHWYQQIARVQIEWHASREAALDAEALAIDRENPEHNIKRPTVQARQQSEEWWAVLHPRSGRMDGWYRDREDAQGVLEYMESTFADECFVLLPQRAGQAGQRITDHNVLKASNSSLWADAPSGERTRLKVVARLMTEGA